MRVNVTTPDCKLTTALLVWSAERQPFLTVHQVQDSAGKPSILDGRLASQAEVLKLLRSLTSERDEGGSGAENIGVSDRIGPGVALRLSGHI